MITTADREAKLAFWMLAPAFLFVTALVIFPLFWNLWLSLKAIRLEDLRGDTLFAFRFTLDNFIKVFRDPDFLPVLFTTFVYTLSGSALSVLLGLFAALLLQDEFPGRGLVRGLFISPYIAPIVAVTFTWSFILDPQLGIFNRLAMDLGLLKLPVPFLSQKWWPFHLFGFSFKLPLALVSVIFFEAWRYFPFAFLFILARLQAIPEDLYLAAASDGASPLQRFRHITLPQISKVLYTLFLFRFIWTLNKFDDIYLLTGGQSGTKVMPLKVYEYAFGELDIGAASAAAMVLFGFLALFLAIYFRWILKEEDMNS